MSVRWPIVDQNPGTASQLADPPAAVLPAISPWVSASPQRSTRRKVRGQADVSGGQHAVSGGAHRRVRGNRSVAKRNAGLDGKLGAWLYPGGHHHELTCHALAAAPHGET